MEVIHRTLGKSVQHSSNIFENIEEIHDFLVKYKLPKLIQKKKKEEEENLNQSILTEESKRVISI